MKAAIKIPAGYELGSVRAVSRGRVQVQLNPVTDRALRYRANATPPPGPKICALCGDKGPTIEVGHVNGREEDTEPRNLFWTCRSCNVLAANTMRKAGIGRLTHQYNPSNEGAQSVGQWLVAVMSMKGQSKAMSVKDAVSMVRATPPARRSEFAKEIWSLRSQHGTKRWAEVPF